MTRVARRKLDVAVVEGCALDKALVDIEGCTLKEVEDTIEDGVEGCALGILIQFADSYALGKGLGNSEGYVVGKVKCEVCGKVEGYALGFLGGAI